MKPYISAIISATVLALIIFGISRTPHPTPQKQPGVVTPHLFTNSEYGWQITYDSNTKRIEYARDPGPDSIHSVIFSGAHTPGDWDFSVSVSPTRAHTLAEFEAKMSPDTVFVEHRTIGGKPAVIYEETSRPGVMFAFMLHNNLIYSIHTNTTLDKEQVWESFEFLF